MKRLLLIFILILSCFFVYNSYGDCSYDWEGALSVWLIEWCIDPEWNWLVSWDVEIWWWFKEEISSWIDSLTKMLAVLAVWSIVYGSFLMVISIWEDEKIKKWKDVIKWGMIWFLWIISAGMFIRFIIGVIMNA